MTWYGAYLALLLTASTFLQPAPEAAAAGLQAGTPQPGPEIVVPQEVNVRAGPSTEYQKIGVLIQGQRARALGRTPGGDWIQIEYLGVPGNVAWVYSPFVVLEPAAATLPIVEPPPTATPRATATIDPTLAAQFNLDRVEPTRLPTFTPASPVIQPTFPPAETQQRAGFPPVLAIAGLLTVGIFGAVISFLRGS